MPKLKKRSATSSCLNLNPGEYYERLNTNDIRRAVISKTPFIAGKSSGTDGRPSVYGRWEYDFDHTLPNQNYTPTGAKPIRYVVYSYGWHFPMYIWDEVTQRWYGNRDKYSRTTTRHQYAANPTFFTSDTPNRAITWLDTDKMIAIARYGVFATVCHAAGGNAFAFDNTED